MKKMLAFFALFIAGIMAVYFNPHIFESRAGLAKKNIPTVATILPTIKTVKEKVKGRGKINSARENEIWIDDAINIDKIHVKQGEKVHQGQVLITMKDGDIKKEKSRVMMDIITIEHELQELDGGDNEESIAKVIREMEIARMEYTRKLKDQEIAKELFGAKAISSKQFDEATMDLRTAELRHEGEKQNLQTQKNKQELAMKLAKFKYEKLKTAYEELKQKETALIKKAPFDGTVTKLSQHLSNRSGEKEPKLVLADPERMEIKLQIDTYDIARVKIDQPVEVYLEEYKQTLFGIVKLIGMEVINKEAALGRESANIIEVTAEIVGQKPEGLKLGTQVEANIVVAEHKNKLMIPSEAILDDDGKIFVYRENNGIAEKIFVKTGLSDADEVEVTAGVNIEDKIITAGNIRISDQARVIAVAPPAAAINTLSQGAEITPIVHDSNPHQMPQRFEAFQ